MMTDPIADMLTRIRNASSAHQSEVVLPYSKIKMGIANLLVSANYLAKAEVRKEARPSIALTLKYNNGQPAINSIKRISRPGHRFYVKNKEIDKVLNGFGIAILSTPQGLLTDADARRLKLGGELVCEVY